MPAAGKENGKLRKKNSPASACPVRICYSGLCAAATIFVVLGYNSAPLIQSKLQQRSRSPIQTVLASSQPPRSDPAPASQSRTIETAILRATPADGGERRPRRRECFRPSLFSGDEKNGIRRDEKQAFRWFSRAADHGSLPAQAKLGFLYWGGRGVPKD